MTSVRLVSCTIENVSAQHSDMKNYNYNNISQYVVNITKDELLPIKKSNKMMLG